MQVRQVTLPAPGITDMIQNRKDMTPNPEAAAQAAAEFPHQLQAAAQAEQKKIIPITQVTAAQAVMRLPRLHGIRKATLYFQLPANSICHHRFHIITETDRDMAVCIQLHHI